MTPEGQGPRVRDFPDDAEQWPDLEDDLIPDPMELPTSGPYGPAFTYLHAARVTLDAGLVRPTKLLIRTAARLTLATADEVGDDPSEEEAQALDAMADWTVDVDDPVEMLDLLATLSAFVEKRLDIPKGKTPGDQRDPPGRGDLSEP